MNQRASFSTRAVPYSQVVQVFSAGMQEQFSPFDDGPAYSPRLDIRTWLEQRCEGKPMMG